jgi:hypothetical protein
MRSVGTTLAAAVMATVLTSSTHAFGGIPFPTETAFKWCFALGAIAAFVGVAIAAFVPRRAPQDDEPVSPRPAAAGRVPDPVRR